MNQNVKAAWKYLLLTLSCLILVYAGAVLSTLFVIDTSPIEHSDPPDFTTVSNEAPIKVMDSEGTVDIDVEKSDSQLRNSSGYDESSEELTESLTLDEVAQLALNDFTNGGDLTVLVSLLTHDREDVRITAANALGYDLLMELNFETYLTLQQNFWDKVATESHETRQAIREALYAALVDSVNQGEPVRVTGFIINMEIFAGEMIADDTTYELFAWMSRTHPAPDERIHAMMTLGSAPQELKDRVYDERAKDPSLRVRHAAWWYQLQDRLDPLERKLSGIF